MSPTIDAASPTEGTTEEATKENAKGVENTTTPTASSTKAAEKGGPPSAIEFEPPLACVRRILKNSLPSSTNVGKDASGAFARASGIFIIYLTACANDFARENRRQTITANDVLAAIKELEFDEFTPELTQFLERYREAEKTKKEAKAKAKEESNAMDDGDDELKVATPQSIKSKGEETADLSMGHDEGEGEQTEEEDHTGEAEGEEEEDMEDMEE